MEALAREFGYDTGERADWTLPLPKLAVEVYHEFTRNGGANGYGRYGADVVTPAELVNWVFVRWAEAPEVTVEWFASLDAPGAMLRTYLQNAARDILHQNVEGNRATNAVSVTPTGFTGAGLDDPTDAPAHRAAMATGDQGGDGFDWLANSADYASTIGNPEEEFETNETLLALEDIVLAIIDGIDNEAQRTMLALYYIDGLEVSAAAHVYGVDNEYGKKALQRARKALGEDDAAALIVWRRFRFPDSGRQPKSVGFIPTAFKGVLA